MTNEQFCYIDHEEQNRLVDAIVARCAADWVIDVSAYAPRLVDMLISAGDQSMNRFEPVIRQIIRESAYFGEGGDACPCDPHHLDQRVRLLLDVLEELRIERQQRSQWAGMPVPPLMCG